MSESQTTAQIQNCLDRLRRGDGAARQDLIAAACERLRRLTHRMLRDYPGVGRWEQTDDVMQNAMLRLCRALDDLPLETPRDFLRVAALQVRRELLDLARRHSGPEGLGPNHASRAGGPAERPPDPGESTADPARLSAWTRFHEKVEALPDDEKDIFDLLWYQELTAAEAARVLGVSESTVKRRWQAARRRLHDLLGGELPF